MKYLRIALILSICFGFNSCIKDAYYGGKEGYLTGKESKAWKYTKLTINDKPVDPCFMDDFDTYHSDNRVVYDYGPDNCWMSGQSHETTWELSDDESEIIYGSTDHWKIDELDKNSFKISQTDAQGDRTIIEMEPK